MNRPSYNPYLRYPRLALAATLGLLALLGSRWLGFEVSTETIDIVLHSPNGRQG